MKTLKNILIAVGIVALVLLVFFLVLGLKVVGTVFVWIMGIVIVLFLVGWISYRVMAGRRHRTEQV